jgi:amidase
VATFITPLSIGAGLRVAIKDLINMRGEITTAGCRAVADHAEPADADAVCIAEIRRRASRGEVHIVGKTNLHELAFGTTGVNEWYGTPINPLDAALIPGGSSSGSAVAVAAGDAEVALGSDTGGSVRIPAACCGIAGLKTTWGRIPLDGVYPLASSFDTIGPLSRDTAGLATGMELLEPGFTIGTVPDGLAVHRLRLGADPVIESAVDAALRAADLTVVETPDPGWQPAWGAGGTLLMAETWRTNRRLVENHGGGIAAATLAAMQMCASIDAAREAEAASARERWRDALGALVGPTSVVALPTLDQFPPPIGDDHVTGSRLTIPVNLAGLPALAIPVPSAGPVPASLQLIGPAYGEALLLAIGARIESAL